jgi:predicted O-methyltransferase YrrM
MQDEHFDFVFMDANKLEYVEYFKLIHPILKKGGVILADNITSHGKKVEPYLNEILNHPQYQSELLKFPDGMLMSLKLF